MTVIDDIVPLSESANRQRVLAIVLKDHSSAPLILESTHEEYKSALADLRQLGLDLGASAINWATLEPMLHLLSSGTKHWATWTRKAVLTMGPLSKTATIPDTAAKTVEEWGPQAPYVLPFKGDGRLALTYIVFAALSSMVGDKGALTNNRTFRRSYIHTFVHSQIVQFCCSLLQLYHSTYNYI